MMKSTTGFALGLNHRPKFDIDEDALIVAVKSVGYVVCGYYGIN